MKKNSFNIQLLRKELLLSTSPLTVFFLLFTGVTVVPRFPILTAPLFVCVGIFYTFYGQRDTGDLAFTVLLPVPKRDTVRAKFLFTIFMEFLGFVLQLILTLARLGGLDQSAMFADNPMMPAGVIDLALSILIYAAFILLFLPGFFKKGRAGSESFFPFFLVGIALMAAGEGLYRVPRLKNLWSTDFASVVPQCAICAVCVVAYLAALRYAYRKSILLFEQVEL